MLRVNQILLDSNLRRKYIDKYINEEKPTNSFYLIWFVIITWSKNLQTVLCLYCFKVQELCFRIIYYREILYTIIFHNIVSS